MHLAPKRKKNINISKMILISLSWRHRIVLELSLYLLLVLGMQHIVPWCKSDNCPCLYVNKDEENAAQVYSGTTWHSFLQPHSSRAYGKAKLLAPLKTWFQERTICCIYILLLPGHTLQQICNLHRHRQP